MGVAAGFLPCHFSLAISMAACVEICAWLAWFAQICSFHRSLPFCSDRSLPHLAKQGNTSAPHACNLAEASRTASAAANRPVLRERTACTCENREQLNNNIEFSNMLNCIEPFLLVTVANSSDLLSSSSRASSPRSQSRLAKARRSNMFRCNNICD